MLRWWRRWRNTRAAAVTEDDPGTWTVIDGWVLHRLRSTPELVYLTCVRCERFEPYRNRWGDPVTLSAVTLHISTIRGDCAHD